MTNTGPLPPPTPPRIPGAQIESMGVPVIFDGLEHREGYRGDFLDLADGSLVPIPMLTDLGRSVAAPLADGSQELKYHKFSVVMHRERRLAILTASNVDWRAQITNGRWTDPRAAASSPDFRITPLSSGSPIRASPPSTSCPTCSSPGTAAHSTKATSCARDDVCWGTSFQDMQMANGDTYHTTNCTPQIAAFNQSQKGLDNWGDLENLIQRETDAEKAIVFAGPVLAPDDRHFHGRDDAGPSGSRCRRDSGRSCSSAGRTARRRSDFSWSRICRTCRSIRNSSFPRRGAASCGVSAISSNSSLDSRI